MGARVSAKLAIVGPLSSGAGGKLHKVAPAAASPRSSPRSSQPFPSAKAHIDTPPEPEKLRKAEGEKLSGIRSAQHAVSHRRNKLRKLQDTLARRAIGLVAFSAIASVALIFIFVMWEALPLFSDAGIREEVTPTQMILPQSWGRDAPPSYSWQPVSRVPKYSLAPLLIGTFKATVVALLFAVPLAILAAIYSAEFAPRRLREFIKPAVEMLAAIPSVVLGFFALVVLASLFQGVFDFRYRLNAIVAGVALGLTLIPVVYTVSEDAILAVPRAYREAALALGASRARSVWSVILPAASPGIFAAVVLGFGRAMGETMIVLMASGNAPILSADPTVPVRTIPATIAAEMGEVVVGGAHWSVLFYLGCLLFLVNFIFNTAGSWAVARLRRSVGGGSP